MLICYECNVSGDVGKQPDPVPDKHRDFMQPNFLSLPGSKVE